MSKNGESVRVTVRCRPLSSAETQTGKQNIVQISSARGEILITKPGSNEQPKAFTFDNVYDCNSSQETIYKESAFPIVDSALQGYNGTIFAYGQTGTGKTHTMEGSSVPEEQRGIIPRAFEQVFHQIQGTPDKQFLVRVSFLEIYNEEIRDLLANNPKNKLELRERPDVGVYTQDLISLPVQSVEEMHQKLQLGRKSRVVAATEMNPGSSRSHSVFTITIEASEIGPDGKSHIRMGKLNLVDLAGSERHDKTGATGDRFVEAVNINKSLLTLGLVISALTDPKGPHIPFRHSKLTRLLQDSLGGNTKTVMIANIGPADWNFEETLNTLRYASQAKKIKNKPKINEDPKDAMLREFQEEINSLKAKIQEFQSSGQVGIQSEKIVKVEDEKRIKEMEEKLAKEKEEIQNAAEEERQRILKQKNLADEERKKLLEELKRQEEAQKEATEEQSILLKKLKKMEQKVLIGSKAMEQALKQEKEHQKIREELEENRINKQILAEQLAKKEEENLMMEKEYKNQKEEVEDKTKKLKRLYQKFQAAQAEIRDLQDDLFREREFYQDELREMDRQFKLRNLIISHFVPNDVDIMIRSRAVWNEEIDDWILPSLHLSGNAVTAAKRSKPGSAHGFVKPIAEQAQMRRSFGDTNTRFRGDNVIDIPIEMPENTLEEFRKTVSKTVRNTVYNTLNMEDEDITLMGMEDKPNVYYMYVDDGIEKEEALSGKEGTKKKRIQSAARVGSAGKKKPEQASRPESRGGRGDEKGVVYPKAKGLVGKNTV